MLSAYFILALLALLLSFCMAVSAGFPPCQAVIKAEDFPQDITKIPDWAFGHCSSLVSIELPARITEIGAWAFSSCSSLVSIELPASLTEIGVWAFYGCPSLGCIHAANSTVAQRVIDSGASNAYHCTYAPTFAPSPVPSSLPAIWTPCEGAALPEKIKYDTLDFDMSTYELSMTGVEVGFFKLIKKIAVIAVRKENNKKSRVSKARIVITPGTSKFPLKAHFTSLDFAPTHLRIKFIGNLLDDKSRSSRSYPIWECVDRVLYLPQ